VNGFPPSEHGGGAGNGILVVQPFSFTHCVIPAYGTIYYLLPVMKMALRLYRSTKCMYSVLTYRCRRLFGYRVGQNGLNSIGCFSLYSSDEISLAN